MSPPHSDSTEASGRTTEPAQSGGSGFDDLTTLAMQVCRTPVALLRLGREQRAFFKSSTGFMASELSRAEVFCGHVRENKEVLVVHDALKDPRFAQHPLVTRQPALRFFAGVSVVDAQGGVAGVLCVLDYLPRALAFEQANALKTLARQVALRLELDHALAECAQHTGELQELNANLEARVRERTAQLQTANADLEAFAQSVAHDLRAPLRRLEGLPNLLLEKHGPTLPADARRHLELLCRNARQMTQLVDDLLAFSRFNHQPLHKETVRTGDLVAELVEVLRREYEERQLVLRVHELCDCQADPALLRQVFVNLIANAIKFTARCEASLIEIGSYASQGCTVYFVADNGVGFDMRQAHKLFSAFQRLHRADEFEGTGLGLSIVRRIVERHGGRIWAESTPGQGARFHFTLGSTAEAPLP
jgi:signal transduction histidine kinase